MLSIQKEMDFEKQKFLDNFLITSCAFFLILFFLLRNIVLSVELEDN